MNLIKPVKLKKGDKIAIVSLSWGGAGDDVINDRYLTAKRRLEDEFGLIVVAMPHALKGSKFVYEHPELRAKDFMDALRDESIKGIFSAIGGDDTIRLHPYIDYDVIRDNPKVFLGYSDTTANHFMMLKSGVQSFYGPSILMEFAENVKMHEYTKKYFLEAIFDDTKEVEIEHSNKWTSERLPWDEKSNNDIERKMNDDDKGYEVLQGDGVVEGHLIGGCFELLDMMRGTELWPASEAFDGAILFLETSEEKPSPDYILYVMRAFASMGMFDRIKGIYFAKPYDEKYYDEYKEILLKVVRDECKKPDLPITYNGNFGHTSPMHVIPYGAMCKLDIDNRKVFIQY